MLTLGYTCYMKLSKNIVLNPKEGNFSFQSLESKCAHCEYKCHKKALIVFFCDIRKRNVTFYVVKIESIKPDFGS